MGKGIGKLAHFVFSCFGYGVGYFSLEVAQEICSYGIRKFKSVHKSQPSVLITTQSYLISARLVQYFPPIRTNI